MQPASAENLGMVTGYRQTLELDQDQKATFWRARRSNWRYLFAGLTRKDRGSRVDRLVLNRRAGMPEARQFKRVDQSFDLPFLDP
jgi:hypothetical protein